MLQYNEVYMHANTKSCSTIAAVIIIMTLQTVQPTQQYLLSGTFFKLI